MRDIRSLERFSAADVDGVRRLADAVERRTGTPPFGETTWLGMLDGGSRDDVGLVVTGASDTADGYAHLARHHARAWSLEVATRRDEPELRGTLLRAALDAVAARGGGEVTLWVHAAGSADDGPEDDAVRGAGMTFRRDLLELRVPLPLATTASWPEHVVVRAFVTGRDEAAWLAVNNRAFAGHPEQGGWDVETLVRREAEPWFDPEGFLLAFDDEGLAGFCWTKVHPPDPPSEPQARGEIYVIGVDPGRQGSGLGRALVIGGLDSLAQRGIRVGMLFVDGDNVAALALYRSLGFTTYRVDRAYGVDVPSRQ
jgi:mycothiol synthase